LKSKQKSISKNKRHLVTIDQISKKTSDAPFGTQLKSKDYAESGIPVIQGRNIKENKFHWNNKKYTSKEKFDSLPRSHCSKGDLIFPKIGTIGNVCILPSIEGNEQCILSTNSMSCSINEKLADPNYIYYYFCQKKIHDYINSTSRGSTQPIFNYGMLKAFSIEIPSLEIQLKVSKILQELDSKIENLQNQNIILDQMAQTIFKSWFVDFDGVTEFEDSELGQIPKGWEIKKLIEEISVTYGFPFKSELFNSEKGIPIIRIRDLKNNFSDTLTTELCDKKFHIFPGDVLLGMDGEFNTSVWLGEESLLNQRVCKLFLKNKILSNLLILFLVKQRFKEYENKISGTTVIHLSKSDIEELKIIFPNDEVLKKFNKFSESLLEKLIKNKNSIFALAKTRDALLPKLMSGEIRV